jgi:hypothetical protein
MSARTLTRLVPHLAPVLLVAELLVPSPAFGDALTPVSGGSPNADDIDTLYKISLYVAIVIFLIVEGTLIRSLVRQRARARRPACDADPRKHAARARLDGRGGADPRAAHRGDLPLPRRHREPARRRPDGRRASQARFASIDLREPPADRPYLRIEVNGQR